MPTDNRFGIREEALRDPGVDSDTRPSVRKLMLYPAELRGPAHHR